MPFCQESLDFLLINRLNDSKEWYNAHRAEHKALVVQPLIELSQALAPDMLNIDPLFNTAPKVGGTLSRIYRDTRFSRDKSMFRDTAWVSFGRPKNEWRGAPGYFFELSPRGLQWGCGWYEAPPEAIACLRESIINDSANWLKASHAFEAQSVFALEGDCYKRSRYADMPQNKRIWLDRKNICLIAAADTDMLFEDNLSGKLAQQFDAIAPVYYLLLDAWERGNVHRREAEAAKQ